MNRIGKTIKAIGAIIKNPWLLNKVLDDNETWKKLIQNKYQIASFPVVEIDELIPGFNETIHHYTFLDGGSLPTDIGMLQATSKTYNNCKYFEIGTWRGESVINVAQYASECYTLNLSKKELLASGLPQDYVDSHGILSKNKINIIHLEGNSLTYDFSKLNKKFDLVFIDGDHRYQYIKNDTEKVFAHLIHDQSTVVWHDYAYDPGNIRYEVMAGILDGLATQYHNHLYSVSNTLCAIYTKKLLKTNPFVSTVIPNKLFTVGVKIRKA
jgi:predicted O-methyltransferase YrrM